MVRVKLVRVLVLVAGAGLASSAWARQDASGRLSPPPAPGVPNIGDRVASFNDFLAAYKRSGRPKMLIAGDVIATEGGMSKGLNEAGTATRFSARLEQYFRHPDVTIVNAEATGILAAQKMNELARNDEFAAAKMLGDKVKADVVLFTRMLEQPPRQDGARYVASYQLVDLRRGTTLASHSFDMFPADGEREFTTIRLAEYARAVAEKICREFAEGFPEGGGSGRAFTLSLIGNYEDDDLSAFRDALRTLRGVQPESVALREEGKGYGRASASFDLAYAGDVLDLRRDARRAAVDQLGMEAEVLGSREGAIELRLAPLNLDARERALTGGAETPRNRDERAKLAAAYAKAGKPTIAFLISQATVDAEPSLATPDAPQQPAKAAQTGDGVNILIGERVDLGNGAFDRDHFLERVIDREMADRRTERRQDAAIDTMYFENKIVERFVRLGMTPRDVSRAQVELAKAGESPKQWSDRELAFALGKQSGADMVVSGVGRLVRDRATSRPVRIIFTTRAYCVSSGDVLATSSVERDLSSGFESINLSVEELTGEATGKMAAQLADKWAGGAVCATTAHAADAGEKKGN